jgi:ubiquinone/menaquinone biosynthesis C-methylase UbiE
MKSARRDRVGSNLELFHDTGIIGFYTNYETKLQNGESAILSRLKTEFSGKRILDVGVGAGRTTPALLDISKRYVGIDVVSSMISACRLRFPSAPFEVCDARDLSIFENEFFDLVFFSFNGIDCVDHVGRLDALREIQRVLADGGAFVFSSHNLRSTIKKPWHSTKLPLRINPLRHPGSFSKEATNFAVEIVNHIRNKRHEEYHDGFAILNDQAHQYRLSHVSRYLDILSLSEKRR